MRVVASPPPPPQRRRPRLARLALPTLVVAVALACAEPPAPSQARRDTPPVVLISIDTLRSDRLPIYGYDKLETPAITALAADGTVFERAYSHYPMTLPSHVSLFTGRLPPQTGVRDNVGYTLAADGPPVLASLLRDAGYATGAAVSTFVLRHETGVARGFDFFDDAVDVSDTADLWGAERRGVDTLERAKGWLAGVAPGRPYLLFFHLYEPHAPYLPPEPFAGRWGETYDGEIAAADAVVGELVGELRRRGDYDRALIVLLSDHGEGLGDHVETTHGALLYREALQVPLVVKRPGAAGRGTRVATPAQLVDVLPTVLAAVGVSAPPGLAGRSLLAAGGGEAAIYSESMYPLLHYGWSDLTSLIAGRYHLIDGPDPELYDLEADPGETRNLRETERRAFHDLRRRLEPFRAPLATPAEADAETVKRLASLGYASGRSGVRDAGGGALRDPKAELERTQAISEKAAAAYRRGDYEETVRLYRQLADEGVQLTDEWERLGRALSELGRHEEALQAFDRFLEISQGSPRAALQAGRTLASLGRLADARALLPIAREGRGAWADELELEIALAGQDMPAVRAAMAVTRSADRQLGRDVRRRAAIALSRAGLHAEAIAILEPLLAEREEGPVLDALAQVQLDAGRTEAALALLDRALAKDPDDSTALETLGLVALQGGRLGTAIGHLRHSLEVNPRAANAWNLLGVALHGTGDVRGALDAWKRAVDLDASQLDALYNLAFTAARNGRRDLAVPALRRYLQTAPPERFSREIAAARTLLGELGG